MHRSLQRQKDINQFLMKMGTHQYPLHLLMAIFTFNIITPTTQ